MWQESQVTIQSGDHSVRWQRSGDQSGDKGHVTEKRVRKRENKMGAEPDHNTPQVYQPTRKTDIPSLQQWITNIEEARKAAQEAQCKVQESWIKDCPYYAPFTIGSKV